MIASRGAPHAPKSLKNLSSMRRTIPESFSCEKTRSRVSHSAARKPFAKGFSRERTNDRLALNTHLPLRGHYFIDVGDGSARARANRGHTHLGSSDRIGARQQSRDQTGQVRHRQAERGLRKTQNDLREPV